MAYFDSRRNKWYARRRRNGELVTLGKYSSKWEAEARELEFDKANPPHKGFRSDLSDPPEPPTIANFLKDFRESVDRWRSVR